MAKTLKRPPTPAEVKKARSKAGLTQEQAAGVVYLGSGVRWSDYETGRSSVPLATWELFLLKAGQRELVTIEEV